MKDGLGRRSLKAVALALFYANRIPLRRWRLWRGGLAWRLGGACERCSACCERPAIRANGLVWNLKVLRGAFLFWQKRVNGFEPAGVRARERLFLFSCSHFDRARRACDSYGSRPGICRDYPRVLLEQPDPRFLPGCGFRPVLRRGEAMLQALDAQGLDPLQRERLVRELRLQ